MISSPRGHDQSNFSSRSIAPSPPLLLTLSPARKSPFTIGDSKELLCPRTLTESENPPRKQQRKKKGEEATKRVLGGARPAERDLGDDTSTRSRTLPSLKPSLQDLLLSKGRFSKGKKRETWPCVIEAPPISFPLFFLFLFPSLPSPSLPPPPFLSSLSQKTISLSPLFHHGDLTHVHPRTSQDSQRSSLDASRADQGPRGRSPGKGNKALGENPARLRELSDLVLIEVGP